MISVRSVCHSPQAGCSLLLMVRNYHCMHTIQSALSMVRLYLYMLTCCYHCSIQQGSMTDPLGETMQCARGRQQRHMPTCDGASTLVGCLRGTQQGIMTRLFSSTVSRALWLLPNTATKCSPADAMHPMRLMAISCMLHVCAVWHGMKSSTSCSCRARLHIHHAASTHKAP